MGVLLYIGASLFDGPILRCIQIQFHLRATFVLSYCRGDSFRHVAFALVIWKTIYIFYLVYASGISCLNPMTGLLSYLRIVPLFQD